MITTKSGAAFVPYITYLCVVRNHVTCGPNQFWLDIIYVEMLPRLYRNNSPKVPTTKKLFQARQLFLKYFSKAFLLVDIPGQFLLDFFASSQLLIQESRKRSDIYTRIHFTVFPFRTFEQCCQRFWSTVHEKSTVP